MNDIEIDDAQKINVEDGDVIVVTMNPGILPTSEQISKIRKEFRRVLPKKKFEILVIPHETKIEVIKASWFEDMEDKDD